MPDQWGNLEELLAGLLEVQHDARNLFVAAHADPKKPRPSLKDLHVPRPGEEPDQTRRVATAEELAQFVKGRGIVRYSPKAPELESSN